jgi:hypothetical protein
MHPRGTAAKTSVTGWLRATAGCRLTELDRPALEDDRRPAVDLGRRQRLAGIVAAYHAAPTDCLLIGWRRERAAGPIDVFAAGSIGGGAAGISDGPAGAIVSGTRAHPDGLGGAGGHGGVDGAAEPTVLTTVPAGARGRWLPAGTLAAALARIACWTRLAGVSDGLLGEQTRPQQRDEPLHPSLEDCLLRAWPGPFGWLVLAEPVPPSEVADEAARISMLEREARTRSSAEYAVKAERLARRYRELRQAETAGLWRVHLLAGGATPAAAHSVAGLLAASADLTDLPYALVPTPGHGTLAEVLDGPVDDAERRSPFLASSALLAALARGPAEEIPGVRLRLRPTFDVTPETRPTLDSVELGQVLDRGRLPVEPARLSRDSLNRHTFVTGATGSGKSQTIRNVLAQASQVGLPWLVVEPAKAEYRLMTARIGADLVFAIRPGDPNGVPAGLNPLQPAPGFPLQTHVDLVRALFVASFESEEPFPQILSTALTRCYTDLGWDLVLGEPREPKHPPRYPTLGDLQQVAERVVTEIGYSKEITDNVLGFIKVRLASLRLGTTGRMFEGGHPIDFDALMVRNVVFEIEDVGDDRDKAFLMGTVLIRLVEHLRVRQRGSPATGLRHLTVFEEAHRLLRRAEQPGPTAHALELFASLLAEIRAYGEGLIIAEQIPSKLLPDAIKNTAVKVVHRLPALDDRQVVGATMNLTDPQSRYLVALNPGTAALFSDGMDFPVLVQMPDGTASERAGAAPPQPATGLVGRRSPTCGPRCRQSPCTLRDMRTAQRLAETHPWVRAWAELTVLAHLTGWPAPEPRPPLVDELRALADRLRECAVSHAVDAAVASRSTVVSRSMSPDALAWHVTAALHGRIRGEPPCPAEEPEWLARPYRWTFVYHALKDADPNAGPDPRTPEWTRRYGRRIPGDTRAAQLQAVHSWHWADLRDDAGRSVVAFGGESPSALEAAAGCRRDDPDWSECLTELLDHFVDCTWPEIYLDPETDADPTATETGTP